MVVEYVTCGKESLIELIMGFFRSFLEVGRVYEDWKNICIVPLYGSKGYESAYANYRGINLMSVLRKNGFCLDINKNTNRRET